ncbi:MAG: iron-containing alcohol dehydrogenase [Chloroflexi bacterium]|nr:iron-containing alcohol dehydrogenase [Chloroflexota bacterium]
MISVAAAWPRKVFYGEEALGQLGSELRRLGAKRAVLATDAYIATTDGARLVREVAGSGGIDLFVFDEVEANTTEGNVNALAREIAEKSCQLVIAVGGGDVIDCAKAANLVATHGGSISDYRINRGKAVFDKVLPLIAIPTTAGTGSEVTPTAVVTDLADKTKYVVSSASLVPSIAILDPALTVSMSPQLTAWTGMDALSRAIEAYSSPADSPIANTLALGAVRRIANNLPLAVGNGDNLPARKEMLLAANMAGVAAAQNQLGLVNATSRQISAEFGVAPSLANAILLPLVMEFNEEWALERFARVAEAMGERVKNLTVSRAAQKAIEAVREQQAAAGIPQKFEGLKTTDDTIHRIACNVMGDPLAVLNPRPVTAHDVEHLLQQVL